MTPTDTPAAQAAAGDDLAQRIARLRRDAATRAIVAPTYADDVRALLAAHDAATADLARLRAPLEVCGVTIDITHEDVAGMFDEATAAIETKVAAARAEALREAAASEAGELAARDAAMRGTLAAPSLATMRALHRAGGCWLVSYDDDDSGDPVTTVEYFDGARALAEKEGDNPVRWVAVDRCGRVCLPPQADAEDADVIALAAPRAS